MRVGNFAIKLGVRELGCAMSVSLNSSQENACSDSRRLRCLRLFIAFVAFGAATAFIAFFIAVIGYEGEEGVSEDMSNNGPRVCVRALGHMS